MSFSPCACLVSCRLPQAPRQIASGLRHFYANESDLTGRKVLVLANLKPRKLAGFASNGMVLCASNAEHTEVKFVEVPASAQVGDRVVFEGDGVGPVVPPADPNKLAKKKLFEKLAPELATDAQGVCNYKGVPFAIAGSGEKCTAPLPNAHVS
jgi:aminoacyl tRNA synthase complex-interacting multifunctional protein 1